MTAKGFIKQEHSAYDDAYDDNILDNNFEENVHYFQYDGDEEDGLIEYVEDEDDDDAIDDEEQLETHTLSIRKLDINGAQQQQVYRCLECAINFATVEDFTKVHRDMQKKKQQQHKNKVTERVHKVNGETDISLETNTLPKQEEEELDWAIVKAEIVNEQSASDIYEDNADTGEFIGISNCDIENAVVELDAEADPIVEHDVEAVGQDDNDNEEDEGEKYFCCDCQLVFGDLESAQQHVCSALTTNKNTSADENLIEKVEYGTNNMHLRQEEEEKSQHQEGMEAHSSSRKVEATAPSGKYLCVQCDKKCNTLQGLQTHMRSHSNKTTKANVKDLASAANPTCPICNTTFSSVKNLKLHLKIHNAQQVRSIEQALPAGAKAQYTDMNKFFCEICNKSFEQNLLGIHKNMHQQTQALNCGICNRHFDNKTSYEMHMQMHADRPIKLRKPQTKAHTDDGNSEKQHQRNGNGRFPCQYCGRTFQRPFEKVRHERVHTGEKPYACEVCGKTFRVPYSLTLHLRTHTDIRPYVCATCNKRFKSQTVYAHHLRTHEAERSYKCEICSKAFRTSVQLSAHRNVHKKPYSCTVCSRPFASLYYVKVHMKTHNKLARTGDTTKYSCYVCGAVYARISALRIHMKELHLIDMDTNEPLQLDDEMIKQDKYTPSRQRAMVDHEEAEDDEEEDVEDDCRMLDNEDDEANEVDHEAAVLIAAAAEADCAAYIETQSNTDAAAQSAEYEVIFPTDELIVGNYQTEEVVTDWLAK